MQRARTGRPATGVRALSARAKTVLSNVSNKASKTQKQGQHKYCIFFQNLSPPKNKIIRFSIVTDLFKCMFDKKN